MKLDAVADYKRFLVAKLSRLHSKHMTTKDNLTIFSTIITMMIMASSSRARARKILKKVIMISTRNIMIFESCSHFHSSKMIFNLFNSPKMIFDFS